jgi:hypothetical protein
MSSFTKRSFLNLYDDVARAELFQTNVKPTQVVVTTNHAYDLYAKQLNVHNSAGLVITDVATYLDSLNTTVGANNDARIADIAAEASSRASSDATLQSNINAEATARSGADATLQTNIDNEQTARESGNSTLQSNLDDETAARQAGDTASSIALGNEVARAQIAEGVNAAAIAQEVTDRSNAVSAEAAARDAADVVLQTNVDTEKGRIDAMLAGSTVDLDQLAELVSAYESADTNILTTITTMQNTINTLTTNLAALQLTVDTLTTSS